MNNLLLAFLGLILFVFCIVDLIHLHLMYNQLKELTNYIKKLL